MKFLLTLMTAWIILAYLTGKLGCNDEDKQARETSVNRRATGITEGVTGRVVDHSGRPVVGANIVATSVDNPSNPVPEIAILTDENGDYSWSLFPGDYTISVVAGSYEGATRRVTVPRGGAVIQDFTLDRSP